MAVISNLREVCTAVLSKEHLKLGCIEKGLSITVDTEVAVLVNVCCAKTSSRKGRKHALKSLVKQLPC